MIWCDFDTIKLPAQNWFNMNNATTDTIINRLKNHPLDTVLTELQFTDIQSLVQDPKQHKQLEFLLCLKANTVLEEYHLQCFRAMICSFVIGFQQHDILPYLFQTENDIFHFIETLSLQEKTQCTPLFMQQLVQHIHPDHLKNHTPPFKESFVSSFEVYYQQYTLQTALSDCPNIDSRKRKL